MLLDFVRVGALIEQVVREAIAPDGLNDTDVWILVVLSGRMDAPATDEPGPMSAAFIATRLGFARERVSMRIPGLVRAGLVRPGEKAISRDGRTRAYAVTAEGNRQAGRAFRALVRLEQELRYTAGIKMNSRAVDPQRVALGLWGLAGWRGDEPTGLDRRRTAGMLLGRTRV